MPREQLSGRWRKVQRAKEYHQSPGPSAPGGRYPHAPREDRHRPTGVCAAPVTGASSICRVAAALGCVLVRIFAADQPRHQVEARAGRAGQHGHRREARQSAHSSTPLHGQRRNVSCQPGARRTLDGGVGEKSVLGQSIGSNSDRDKSRTSQARGARQDKHLRRSPFTCALATPRCR